MDSEINKDKSDIENAKLCNGEDLVKLILDNFGESLRVMNECSYGRKSPGESEKFRHSGNLLLNSISPNLEGVLKLYSKSVFYAPPGSEQLSLAYANRSAVLFRGKYYEECLEDISRALETGYPDSLKPKLFIRRVKCNYALTGNVDFAIDEGLIEARALIEKLPATNKMRKMVEDTLNNPERITSVGRQAEKTRPKYQPEMKGKNPHLPGASDAIALRYSEEYGRHLVATRDISAGEILLIERPYAAIVAVEWIYCICSHCARRSWNGIPCDYCVYVMFCSAECKRAAWEEYHEVECKIFEFAKRSRISDNGFMGLRMTVKAIKEAGSVEALRKRLKELDAVEASNVEIPINPNSYETFYIMSGNPERQKLEKFACSLTYTLAVKTNLLGKKIIGSLREVEDSEQLLFVADLMSENMRIAKNRTFGWRLEDKSPPEEFQVDMLMPVSSFFNSRCYDTTEQLRFDKDITVVTYVPYNKGEQIFTRYCFDYKTLSRDRRRSVLKNSWQFDCNCLACKHNWSASTSTHWTNQDMPPRIVAALHDGMKKLQCPNEEAMDPMEMISLKEEFCRALDFIYPRMKKPCINVEYFVKLIERIDIKLGFVLNPRFDNKF